ncbi:TPA: hypothetical protein HA259_09360 [Thermoplasmata archaeon]|nr:hypothetical protein [Thermoplasmata archaeon]
MDRSFVAVAVGVVVGVMLVLVGFYGMLPRHVEKVSYSDPVDAGFAAEFDVVALSGELIGPEFVITLVMRGYADPDDCWYSAIVVARIADSSEDPHIYRMEFYDGYEHNYYVFTYLSDGDLVFKFPLDRLLDDSYIVGLEASASGFSGSAYGTDWINTGNRSEMSLAYALDLGLDPLVPLIAGICALTATVVVFTIRFGDGIRGTRMRPK